MIERRKTRQIRLGAVWIGSEHPISVQSMTTTKTADIDGTLQQIASLNASGCDIVRVAVPDTDDVAALPAIARKSPLPVVADIHFQWKYAIAALEAGCQGIRINPGNIKKHDKVALIGREAAARGVPIRIGVNAGSIEAPILERYGGPTPEAMRESALNEIKLLEDVGFHDIKVSVKHNDPRVMIEAYRLLAAACDYPLHLGVTEAGTPGKGIIKSAVGIGTLLAEGIGDTIRVSLTADVVEEVQAGIAILESLGLRAKRFDLVSCPSCGRAEVDVVALASQVEARLKHIDVPMTVAVMGCVVNGPGEAREADVGIAGGKGKGQLFLGGEVVGQIPEGKLVDALCEYVEELAEIKRAEGQGGTGTAHVVRVTR
jgi:(E)-4-hydroxy-3-methylbut-2-enyl-diphosphate synthase